MHLASTHCNTRQHTATHCNNTLQCGHGRCHHPNLAARVYTLPGCAALRRLWHQGIQALAFPNSSARTTTHWNTLHHTASHCNILRYTATHCSTLQHTATHCNTCLKSIHTTWLYCSSSSLTSKYIGAGLSKFFCSHCNTVEHTTSHCITLQHTAIHCNTLQHMPLEYTHYLAVLLFVAFGIKVRGRCHDPIPLQHTAAHCNTLQHTATHCNIL